MQFFGKTNIDFIGLRKVAFVISGIAICIGIISLALKGGPKLGLDFTGGIEVHFKFNEFTPISRVRAGLSKIGLGNAVIQSYGKKDENLVLVRFGVEEISKNIASEIVAYREKNGKFTTLEELKDIRGINSIGYENLVKFITINPSQKDKININQIKEDSLAPLLQQITSQKMSAKIEKAVKEEFKERKNAFIVRSINLIGPKISEELRKGALLAIAFSLVGMLIYISWRFKLRFAVGAVVALTHDVFISVGALSLCNFEFNLTVIAALLTIIGYSLNDTIVIYDRIRENFKTYRKKRFPYKKVFNLSINQSLSRTVITSLTTFVVVLALFLWGGAAIHGFAFALLVGVIVGTYSSSFVATPVVYTWGEDKTKRR
ncbi:protein translocase subunit SecF [Candidatus Aerophobetes bacterium]|nr:protein translocase subunit SecF [Candidatus Aerophobetes bacterium]